jgi:hypothetical protein
MVIIFTETFTTKHTVAKAKMEPGLYRSIMGNQATAMGLIAASQKWPALVFRLLSHYALPVIFS